MEVRPLHVVYNILFSILSQFQFTRVYLFDKRLGQKSILVTMFTIVCKPEGEGTAAATDHWQHTVGVLRAGRECHHTSTGGPYSALHLHGPGVRREYKLSALENTKWG